MPQHEKKVAIFLKKKGIEHYLPLVSRKRKWSDRIKIIDFPLFPGYIFTKIDWFKQHVSVLTHPGSLHFLKNEDGPAYLTDQKVADIRTLIEAGKDTRADPFQNFPAGEEVEVTFGPFKGIRCVVEKVKNSERIYIKVPFLNQLVSTEIDVIDVQKVQ